MSESDLRHQLATLTAVVESLRAQLESVRLHAAPTMRTRLRCPVCATARIAHAKSVLDRGDGDTRKVMALNRPSWWSDKLVGELEVYACTGCGYVEWYVKDPGALREVKPQIEILDGESTEAGPYR